MTDPFSEKVESQNGTAKALTKATWMPSILVGGRFLHTQQQAHLGELCGIYSHGGGYGSWGSGLRWSARLLMS